jgi:hypothetical protein
VLAVVYSSGSSIQLLGGFRYSAAGGVRGGASATLPRKYRKVLSNENSRIHSWTIYFIQTLRYRVVCYLTKPGIGSIFPTFITVFNTVPVRPVVRAKLTEPRATYRVKNSGFDLVLF